MQETEVKRSLGGIEMYDPDRTPTAELKNCQDCGFEQHEGDKYCRHCGTRQTSVIEREQVAETRTKDDLTATDGLVLIVDDDHDLCESLKNLIRSVGLGVEAYPSAQELLASRRPDVPRCLLLDVRLPGLSGLDLQKRMAESHMDIPIIFMTGHADIPMTVQAMKAGAVEFLTKPFRDQDLLDAIQHALERDRKKHEERKEIEGLRHRFEAFTHRERELMALMVHGCSRCRAA